MSNVVILAVCLVFMAIVQGPSFMWGAMAFALGVATRWYMKN